MTFLKQAQQHLEYLRRSINNSRLHRMSTYDYWSGFEVGTICAYGHAARVEAGDAYGYGSEQYIDIDCMCMSLYNESKFLLRNAHAAIELQQSMV